MTLPIQRSRRCGCLAAEAYPLRRAASYAPGGRGGARHDPVTEEGRRKKITKREAVAKQLVNKAAAGDPKAIPVLLHETRAYETTAAVLDVPHMEITSPEDQAVIESIIRRIREATGPVSSAASPEPAVANRSTPNPPTEDDGIPT